MLNKITFENLPQAVELLLNKIEAIEKALNSQSSKPTPLPKTIPLKKAAEIGITTTGALRMQIHLGNLKCFHRGNRVYLDTEYFQRWLRGEDEPDSNPLELLKR